MKKPLFVLTFIALLYPTCAHATKPCPPNTWFANPHRPSADWSNDAAMVFVGTIENKNENIVPYPNCALDDKSKCAQLDNSTLSVRIMKWEKGETASINNLQLMPGFCAQNTPASGSTLRFYTNPYNPKNGTSYIFYEPAN